MTIEEAKEIMMNHAENEGSAYDEEEEFAFIEAMNFLINELHDPDHMLYLGGYYYELRQFDLALKYYEMAAAMDYDPAYECLGYIWYYGRTGERDFKKAFEYFSRLKEKGDLTAAYKVADMYKNGYYVEKDIKKYEEIIEEIFPIAAKCKKVFDPIPEIFTRMARIKTEKGEYEAAVDMYLFAKDVLAQRIKYNAFFGNLNIMKWMIDDLYELIEFDYEYFDFFDLYYLLKDPHKVSFMYEDQPMQLESVIEEGECVICFNGSWYRNRDEFFGNACVNEQKAVKVWDAFYNFEVIE